MESGKTKRKFKLNNKEILFKIYNPGGNKTALVYKSDYTKSEISQINNYILKCLLVLMIFITD